MWVLALSWVDEVGDLWALLGMIAFALVYPSIRARWPECGPVGAIEDLMAPGADSQRGEDRWQQS
jgi:hypothetical protein